MSKGQIVTVKLYGGKTATRRVVAVKRDSIVICAEEEYQQAEAEGREPEGLGFPKEDVEMAQVSAPRKDARMDLGSREFKSRAGD